MTTPIDGQKRRSFGTHEEDASVVKVLAHHFHDVVGWKADVVGGTEPRWRADGKEMFYFAGDNRLMAVEITTEGGTFEVGQGTPLFLTRETWIPGNGVRYDVSEDGQRFLVISPWPTRRPRRFR